MRTVELTYKSVVCLLLVFCGSCASEEKEAGLAKALVSMDDLMKAEVINYNDILREVSSIKSNLVDSTYKHYKNDRWESFVKFKWNQDSSVVMILSSKYFTGGLKKEAIIHTHDSVFFMDRFLIMPEMDVADQYVYIKTVDYCTSENVIRSFSKLQPRNNNLSDTVAFKQRKFNDITSESQNHYAVDLEYARDIMNRN